MGCGAPGAWIFSKALPAGMLDSQDASLKTIIAGIEPGIEKAWTLFSLNQKGRASERLRL